MWTLLFPLAAASSVFLDVADPVAIEVGGGWARALPADTGWHLLFAAGGEYFILPMTDALEVDDHGRLYLTGHDDLIDHNFVACPDGTYLHTASALTGSTSDVAWAFRYDADFDKVAEERIISSGSGITTNDMSLTCAGGGNDWMGLSASPGREQLYRIGADASATLLAESGSAPQLMGGSLVWEEERGDYTVIGRRRGQPLKAARYDTDGVATGEVLTLGLEDGGDAYWPSSWMRVGDHYLLAYMWRVDDGTFDSDFGNVRLALFDLDWNLVETRQLTSYAGPLGAMRPSLARKADRLLVTFDVDRSPYGVYVGLDAAALGIEEEDTGDTGDTGDTADTGDTGDSGDTTDTGETGDSGDSADTGDSGETDGADDTAGDTGDDYKPRPIDEPTGCGCTTGGGAGGSLVAGLLVGLAAVGGRRTRRTPRV